MCLETLLLEFQTFTFQLSGLQLQEGKVFDTFCEMCHCLFEVNGLQHPIVVAKVKYGITGNAPEIHSATFNKTCKAIVLLYIYNCW